MWVPVGFSVIVISCCDWNNVINKKERNNVRSNNNEGEIKCAGYGWGCGSVHVSLTTLFRKWYYDDDDNYNNSYIVLFRLAIKRPQRAAATHRHFILKPERRTTLLPFPLYKFMPVLQEVRRCLSWQFRVLLWSLPLFTKHIRTPEFKDRLRKTGS
jgi:hypothetical protein